MPTEADEAVGVQSIYQVARLLKKGDNTLWNCVHSCLADRAFVNEISSLYATVPVAANLRCGAWYVDPCVTEAHTCYFKSTDGHNGNWSFSTTRLNWHVAELAAKQGGVIIVDATRSSVKQGFPDAFNKTVPIWACVLNRAVARVRAAPGSDLPQPQPLRVKRTPSFTGWLGAAARELACTSLSCSAGCVSHSDEASSLLACSTGGLNSDAGSSSPTSSGSPEDGAADGLAPCAVQHSVDDDTALCSSGSAAEQQMRATCERQSSMSGQQAPDGNAGTSTCVSGSRHVVDLEDGSGEVECEVPCSPVNGGECEWDTSLHLPLWISSNERKQIEARLEGFVDALMVSGAGVVGLARLLAKPLRPLWISQSSRIWIDQVAQPSQLPFTPLILLSASALCMHERRQRSMPCMDNNAADHGEACTMYTYIPGAGDDEESWAHGLTPELLALHQQELEASTPETITGLVKALVSHHKQHGPSGAPTAPLQPTIPAAATQQQAGPEASTSTQPQAEATGARSFHVATDAHHLRPQGCDPVGPVQVRQVGQDLFALGATGILLGGWAAGAPPHVWEHVDAVLNVGSRQHPGMAAPDHGGRTVCSGQPVEPGGLQPAVRPAAAAAAVAARATSNGEGEAGMPQAACGVAGGMTSAQASLVHDAAAAHAQAQPQTERATTGPCSTGLLPLNNDADLNQQPQAKTRDAPPHLPDPFLAAAAHELEDPTPPSLSPRDHTPQDACTTLDNRYCALWSAAHSSHVGPLAACSARIPAASSRASLISEGSDIITVCSLGEAGMGPGSMAPTPKTGSPVAQASCMLAASLHHGRPMGGHSPLSRVAANGAHASPDASTDASTPAARTAAMGRDGPAADGQPGSTPLSLPGAESSPAQQQAQTQLEDEKPSFEFASSSSMTNITPANYISLNLDMPDEERACIRQQMEAHDLEASQPPTPTRYCLMPWAVIGPQGVQPAMYGVPVPGVIIPMADIQGQGAYCVEQGMAGMQQQSMQGAPNGLATAQWVRRHRRQRRHRQHSLLTDAIHCASSSEGEEESPSHSASGTCTPCDPAALSADAAVQMQYSCGTYVQAVQTQQGPLLHSTADQSGMQPAHGQAASETQGQSTPSTLGRYLWQPVASSKLQRTALMDALGPALDFLSAHLAAGHTVLILDDDGLDQCVCVALALLLACYGPAPCAPPCSSSGPEAAAAEEQGGSSDAPVWAGPVSKDASGSVRTPQVVTKHLVRRRLALLSGWYPHARPTRGMLKQVFNFFHVQSTAPADEV